MIQFYRCILNGTIIFFVCLYCVCDKQFLSLRYLVDPINYLALFLQVVFEYSLVRCIFGGTCTCIVFIFL